MNARIRLEDLQSQIDSQILVLDETATFLATMLADEIRDHKDRKNGLVVAGILENYYTAAETVLFRIVQEFCNSLRPDHRHADLLERLARELPETRPRVLLERRRAGFVNASNRVETESASSGRSARSWRVCPTISVLPHRFARRAPSIGC